MPPVQSTEIKKIIDSALNKATVVIFSKTTCPFCKKVKVLLTSEKIDYYVLELDQHEHGEAIQNALFEMTGQKTVPNVFINKKSYGGCDDITTIHKKGELKVLISGGSTTDYDYDLIVIGGGSGGISAAKEAASLGMKVCLLDFVAPSPQGTTWGLGGTCVNVGCIPKKLMHQAAQLGHYVDDAKKFGWSYSANSSSNGGDQDKSHEWSKLVQGCQDYIGGLNWNYRVQLRKSNVTYINAFARFIGNHKIKAVNKKGVEQELTAAHFIIATGGRPRYPDEFEGCKEHCVSSDDLFSLPYHPGKVLVIGASYVSLECAGFLNGLGYDVTVMVRSILLRGFDQQIAELIGKHMQRSGVKFIRPCVPSKIEKIADGKPGNYKVTSRKLDSNEEVVGEYNTVLIAVGREPCTSNIGLDVVGVKTDKSGFILSNAKDGTNIDYIHAIGDVLAGKPELTPVAIVAGKLMARRLFGGSKVNTNYDIVPTTIFTPLEYGTIGLSEEAAIEKYGENDIEVYHSNFMPLEWTVAELPNNDCYCKLVCVKSKKELVVGLHYLGPNGGEVAQGFALGMKLGATKNDFDMTIGIHPTTAEIFTTLSTTKSSGANAEAKGC